MAQHNDATEKELQQIKEFKAIFEPLEVGAFVYDQQGIIQLINSAAIRLLGLESAASCIGKHYQQLIHLFEPACGYMAPVRDEYNPMTRVFQVPQSNYPTPYKLYLQKKDGDKVLVELSCASLTNATHQPDRGMCVVYLAELKPDKKSVAPLILALMDFVDTAPDAFIDIPFSKEDALLLDTEDIRPIAQHAVELIYDHLGCEHVWLATLDESKEHVRFIAMAGLEQYQDRIRWIAAERFPVKKYLNPFRLRRLMQKGMLIAKRDSSLIPPELNEIVGEQTLLNVPLLAGGLLIGTLNVGRHGNDSSFSPDDVEFVKAMASLLVLILKQYRLRSDYIKAQANEQALRELNQRTNEFLNLASHELRTPLTVVSGNIQLAQRRLRSGIDQGEHGPSEQKIVDAISALDEALEGARLQERMINDMLDDSRIQNHTLVLHRQLYDITTLVNDVVVQVQQQQPNHLIELDMPTLHGPVMAMLDVPRITRVLDTYIRNALNYSPVDRPVSVRVYLEDKNVCISVHDHGPGIPLEEQGVIWERFYRGTGIAVQHELDLSLGLGLYLCRAFVELHQGSAGLQSAPGKSTTFWFTLPLAGPEQSADEVPDTHVQ